MNDEAFSEYSVHFGAEDHTAPSDFNGIDAPTCEDVGYNYKKCTVCGFILEKEEISALDHKYEGSWKIGKLPTCTEDGSMYRICKNENCGKKETSVLEASGHSFADEFTVDIEATCKEVGSKSRKS